MAVIIFVGLFFIYFLPAIIGFHSKYSAAIFIVNLLVGWTILGWALTLIWACVTD